LPAVAVAVEMLAVAVALAVIGHQLQLNLAAELGRQKIH
jgi:hypothetical protein